MIYVLLYLFGFISLYISVYLFNKKYRIMDLEYLIYSYILFILFFMIFAKIGYVLINLDFGFINQIFSSKLVDIISFAMSSYAFIGGYVGCILYTLILNKIFKIGKYNLMVLYIPNMLLFYSILKIGCFIRGCCGGIIPIQIVESLCCFITYIYICYLMDADEFKIIKISIIMFGLLRLILSLFRIYNSIYQFIMVEIICVIIIIYGVMLKTIKK